MQAFRRTTTSVTNNSDEEEEEDSHQELLAIADTALSRLEFDYQRTVSAEATRIATESSTPTVAVASSPQQQAPSSADASTDESECPPAPAEDVTASSTQHCMMHSPPPSANTNNSTPTSVVVADTAAVQRTVSRFQWSPQFHARYETWKTEQQQQKPVVSAAAPVVQHVPHHHSLQERHTLIPSSVVSLFQDRMTMPRAEATAALTRSATLADACMRLDDVLRSSSSSSSCWHIHIIGCCDAVEGGHHSRSQFAPFVEWWSQNSKTSTLFPARIQIDLIGPELTNDDHPVNLLPLSNQTNNTTACSLQSAQLFRHGGLYEDFLEQQQQQQHAQRPHLIVAFHPGVWGYASWRPCCEAMVRHYSSAENNSSRIPFVCTAYTLEEAEEDGDVLGQVLAQQCCVWPAEPHRFGSHMERPTATAPLGLNSQYRENAAWQCWMV